MSSRAHLRDAATILVRLNPGCSPGDLVGWLTSADDRRGDIVAGIIVAVATGRIVIDRRGRYYTSDPPAPAGRKQSRC